MNCPECGSKMRNWYNSKDELVQWTCDKCGHEEKVEPNAVDDYGNLIKLSISNHSEEKVGEKK